MSDENRDLESTAAQEDSLSENELTDCLLALRSGKATGWDNIPIEAYRGSSGARNELFRIWTDVDYGAGPRRPGERHIHNALQERPARRLR